MTQQLYIVNDDGTRTPVDPARFGQELQRAKHLTDTSDWPPMGHPAVDRSASMLGWVLIVAGIIGLCAACFMLGRVTG